MVINKSPKASFYTNICVVNLSFLMSLKGPLPQHIFILKSGHVGHINSLNIDCSKKKRKKIADIAI